MGRYDFRPSRVHRTATMLLASQKTSKNSNPTQPPWYKAVSDYPPTESIIRTLPVQHQYHQPLQSFSSPKSVSPIAPRLRRTKKPSKLFAPQQIAYEEDALRSDFFTDHPWELARPRQILEDDGKDYQRWDWSQPHEPGRPVNGESVIQRQLHLMHHHGRSKTSAYDQARREHYAQRHLAETETRIAREEARAVGASFGLSANQVGMQLENKTFEQWRAWAEAQVNLQEQMRSAAYSGESAGEAGADDTSAEGGLEAAIDQLGSGPAGGRGAAG